MSSNAPGEEAQTEEVSVNVGDPDSRGRRISPWAWVPTVYFAQGLQYAIVIQLFVVIFFTMGLPLGETLLWVGLLQLPWTIKPLWGPLVDKYWTKRGWTYTMQMLVGACFVGSAFSLLLPGTSFLYPALFFLFGLAFAAATHDIACDGYYMMGLNEKQQAFYVGVRSTVFRVALIFANGILIWFAGLIQTATGLPKESAQLQVSKAPEAAVVQAVDPDQFFAGTEWPVSSEQSILIMPEVLETTAGEETFVTVRLAREPEGEEPTVVTLRLKEGDVGIKVPKEYERIEFNRDNWSRGIDIPVSSDPKTRNTITDRIEAQAGNIPLSWWVVCLICGAFYLVVFIYHKFMLPYPSSDKSEGGHKPFFLIPVILLAVTIGVPWGIGWGIYKGLGTLRDNVQSRTIGLVEHGGLQTLRGFVDPGDANKAVVTSEQMMSVVDSIRTTELTSSAAELQAILKLRRTLQTANVLGSDNMNERIFSAVEKKLNDPQYYGSPSLIRLFTEIKALNKGELPKTREELDAILAKAESPVFAELPENSSSLLGALSAVESVKKAEAETGTTDALPKSAEELNQYISMSLETPTPLEVKGFNFFFTAARLIILVILGGIILWIPALWAIAAKFFHLMSAWSHIGFAEVFGTFFGKAGMGITLGFLLLFRLGEAQLAQVKSPFLLASRETGGLALSLGEFAFTNGVVYLVALTVGGLLGGFLIANYGLKKIIWPMVGFMHLPNLLYIYLANYQPTSLVPVNVIIGFESFGYGLGFTAYLMVMILAAQGPYKTAHYALCTGAMALGYMIPGMWSGYLQELVGYTTFFMLVMLFVIPGTVLIPFLTIDPEFGKKARRST